MRRDNLAIAEAMSAADILAISAAEPEKLFEPDADAIGTLYKRLAKKWHPDLNREPSAKDVFQRVAELKVAAEEKLARGAWHTPGQFKAMQKSGTELLVKYLKRRDFELGEMYIGRGSVTYVVRPEFADLYENAARVIGGLKYPNDKFREQFAPQLPKILKATELADGARVLIVERDPEKVFLSDLLEFTGGKLEAKHVAWVASRLHNITCYLQWAGLAHNALTLDTCLVSPKDHTFAIAGGWWYAVPQGRPLIGLPGEVVKYAPRAMIEGGRATIALDQAMVRVIGRQLLGDPVGVRMAHNPDIPRPMADWLALPGSGDAIKDFETWQNTVLKNSFGPRRFADLSVKPSDVYQPS